MTQAKSMRWLLFIACLPTRSCVSKPVQSFAHEQATAWTKEAINKRTPIPAADRALIAELCSVSRDRSRATRNAQQAGLQALNTFNTLWHMMTQTRLNPSKETAAHISFKDAQEHLEQFQQACAQHQETNKRYAQCSEKIIKGSVLSSAAGLKAVKDLRARARTVVAHAIKKHPGKRSLPSLKSLENPGPWLATVKYLAPCINTGIEQLAQAAWNLLPTLSVTAFAQVDHEYCRLGAQAWEMLYRLERTSVNLWESIEVEREAYYQACLDALTCTMD